MIAYSVSKRTREIGVRMALAAQRNAVYGLVMRQAGWLTVTGLALGLSGAVGLATLIRNTLFGVAAWDTATLLAVAACWVRGQWRQALCRRSELLMSIQYKLFEANDAVGVVQE